MDNKLEQELVLFSLKYNIVPKFQQILRPVGNDYWRAYALFSDKDLGYPMNPNQKLGLDPWFISGAGTTKLKAFVDLKKRIELKMNKRLKNK